MWWEDEGLSLLQHGDRFERLWWPLLEKDFPQYERFWLKHIIPLTNRIDPDIDANDPKWIGFRDDDNIKPEIESMAMAHYSVFYHLARATLIIFYEPCLYFEDAFSLLASAIYNLPRFSTSLQKALGASMPILSSKDLKREPFREILRYRDTLVHAPILARAHYPAFAFSNSRANLILGPDANIHAGSSVNTAFRR